MSKLLIVDGNAIMHRCFHALPDFSTNNTPTNAVYGFISALYRLTTQYTPTHIAVCFDSPGKTFRDKLFIQYRAQRPKTDDKLLLQFPLAIDFLDAAGIAHFHQEGIEADDIIGSIVKKTESCGFINYIATGDKDLLQLVDNKTFVVMPKIGYTKDILFTIDAVNNKMGVQPFQIPDLKALAGDPSDNYKGIVGIGPKTAISLLNNFTTIENLYKYITSIKNETLKDKLVKYKKDALLSKKLAVIITDQLPHVKLDEMVFFGYNQDNLVNYFKKMRFNSFLKRFFLNPQNTKKEIKTDTQMDLFK